MFLVFSLDTPVEFVTKALRECKKQWENDANARR
jgi:hypothetical protein